MSSQFVLKTPQDIELYQGYPEFSESWENTKDLPIISSIISPCGRFFAISTKSNLKVFTGENLNNLLLDIELIDAYDLKFSPSGNYLSSWERPLINDSNHQNVKIWYLNQGFEKDSQPTPVYQYQYKSQNSWSLQFSKMDDFVFRQFGKDLKIIKISHDANVESKFNFDEPFATLSNEVPFSAFSVSPADFPTVCTFTPEKSGKPAQLTIWPVTQGKIVKKIVTKTFFKADSCQLKWNDHGNAILGLAITDFDATNKSYYGENTLYMLSFQGVNGTLGGSSVRVNLSNGPVHDFTWSPTSRQFGVIAGFMPATISFFDMKGNVVHSLPQQSKNTMLFSPNGKYILIGGFGNLTGSVEILDRHNKFNRITQFDASNTSVCKWSPGGEFIITATTSPRLRVDNCIKIWHVSGQLCFIKEFKELLKVDWRNPCKFKLLNDSHIIKDWTVDNDEELKIDPKIVNKSQLKLHEGVIEYQNKRKAVGNGSVNTSNKSNKSAGAYKPPHARRVGTSGGQRVVPGMAPAAGSNTNNARKRRSNNKNNANANGNNTNNSANANGAGTSQVAVTPEEKKIRSLLKKLRSIETLKQRQINGDKLEDTQILKIKTEDKVVSELESLGWKEETA
ncbi:hypothetical protein KAFR_0A06260 [Kazachstania africana CBS 2517]|uniref:Eukaryotic translation initiation factor 2A n=1 Tax=Kazachstania africana (strain ATCC 22294 / BCRC 22015 / CBS 2517 / CECT 1963 / NBRC 1671 / NRRL Y-8276) TaxID=1071382 RepID=H2ANW1_KAZAF|nr:hypothetical protein KAFR_0A06260 [Kazachstania africana CBS 2517]CCF56061.1 hypothetical protein KAFR_0A06260 [Kazachstania africana CBS 2517]